MSERPDEDLNTLADALRGLQPRPVELDRAALMFQAGRASARYGWIWPVLSAALVLVSLGLGATLLLRPAPQGVVEVCTVRVPVAPEEPPSPEPRREAPTSDVPPTPAAVADSRTDLPRESYLRLLHQVETTGDLEPAPAAGTAPASPMLNDLLDLPDETLQEPWLQRRRLALQTGDPS